MAPTKKDGDKEDKPKLNPQEAAKAIMEYLRKTNRPYSPTEVSGNLKIGLALAKKLLKDMHERQEIACGTSGKQQVYHVIQDEIEHDHAEKLYAMNEETARLKEDANALRSEEKDLRASLQKNNVKIPLPQLKANVEDMEQEKVRLGLRLERLRRGNLKLVDAAERDKINKSYRYIQKAATARKKIRGEVWKILLEAYQNANVEDLKEQLDLEL